MNATETKTTVTLWTQDALKVGGRVFDANGKPWTILSATQTGRTRRTRNDYTPRRIFERMWTVTIAR